MNKYVIAIGIFTLSILLLVFGAAYGAYDVGKIIKERGYIVSYFDHYDDVDPDGPYLLWLPHADKHMNISTPVKANIDFVKDTPWVEIEHKYLNPLHEPEIYINGDLAPVSRHYEMHHFDLFLFEYLRNEIKSLKENNYTLNQTIRLQSSHVQALHELNLELSDKVDALNQTISTMQKKEQGIAPLN